MSEKTINDPELYRRMSIPFATESDAERAGEGFYADLRAIREKHRIRNVLVVYEVGAMVDGDELAIAGYGVCGDVHLAESLAAFGLARASQDHSDLVMAAARSGKQ